MDDTREALGIFNDLWHIYNASYVRSTVADEYPHPWRFPGDITLLGIDLLFYQCPTLFGKEL
jgi:hypothetical protein